VLTNGKITGCEIHSYSRRAVRFDSLQLAQTTTCHCRYPDAFAAALMNSLPIGFYAPVQIIIGDGDNCGTSNKIETIDAIMTSAF